jgi:hypothetical protein
MGNLLMPESLRGVLARCRLLPAQNPTAATPRPGRSKAELGRDLQESFEGTRELLAANLSLPWDGMVVVHPLLGRHDVPGILRFLAHHESRHQAQIREALAAVSLTFSAAQVG